jgi:hypothetical protein
VVAARLVSHELVRADVDRWREESAVDGSSIPLNYEMWQEHRSTLARVLHSVDWEMLNGSYTWVELINGNPPRDGEWSASLPNSMAASPPR